VYQSSFVPNTQWSEEFAQGTEILKYWQEIANKYDQYRYLELETTVKKAQWSDDDSVWKLTLQHPNSGKREVEADVLLTAIGCFNSWQIPDYPGLNDYEGFIRHSSNWDPTFDLGEKKVAVIGNGASGIQLVPNLQRIVQQLDHYVRNGTWVTGAYSGDSEGTLEPKYFSKEQLKSFEVPEVYLDYRKRTESQYWQRFESLFRNSEKNKQAKEDYIKVMGERVRAKPEFLEQLIPQFAPHCSRLTIWSRHQNHHAVS
jgi:cation diffusion facilitator CzcD-associated flavoprotein CzcO